MSWSAISLPFAVAVLIYLVPGLTLAWAAGRRGTALLLLAPALSVGLVGGGAILLGAIGIRFTALSVLTMTLLIATATALTHRVIIKKHGFHNGKDPNLDRAERSRTAKEFLAIFGGLIANLLVFGWTYASALSGPDGIFQNYDSAFHFSVITYLVKTGNGSSIGAADVDRTVGSSFYPAGWHDSVALIMTTTNAWIPVAVTASVLAMLFVAFPLSAMALTRAILPNRPLALLATGAVGGIFGAFPVRYLIWGILYSNALSWCVLPGAMALFIGSLKPGARWGAYGLTLVAVIGVAVTQPNGIFTAALLLTPFLITRVWATTNNLTQRLILRGIITIGFLIIAIFLWVKTHGMEFMQRTVTYDWPAHTTIPGAIREVLTEATNGMPASPIVAAAVLAALAAWLLRSFITHDRSPWPAVSLLLAWTVYIIGSGIGSVHVPGAGPINTFRDILTGFWYHDQIRLAAIPVIIAIPLLASGIDLLAQATQTISQRQWTGVAVTLIVLSVIILPAVTRGEIANRRPGIRAMTTLSEEYPLTASELAFLQEVERTVPKNAVILNDPYDGSAYGYSLVDLNMAFRSYETNWIGKPTPDQDSLHTLTNQVAQHPDLVCPVLQRADVTYVLVMDNNDTSADGSTFILYDPNFWSGLNITPQTPGFEKIISDDSGDALYEVTACG